MTNLTKDAIKRSFMKLLNRKQLSKITVKEIVEDCGINRNSFYYHFADIPALVEEILNEQAELMMHNSEFNRYLNRIASRTITAYFNTHYAGAGIAEDDKQAIVMYYKSLLVGFVIEWLESGMKYDLRIQVQRLCELFEGTTETAIARCKKAPANNP